MGTTTDIKAPDGMIYRVEARDDQVIVRKNIGGRIRHPLFRVKTESPLAPKSADIGAVNVETILALIDVFYQGKNIGENLGMAQERYEIKESIAHLLEPVLDVIFDVYQGYKDPEKQL